jgi:prefoldin beta subunit
MAEENIQQAMAEFEKNRMQLVNLSNQKQQLQLHSHSLADSVAALKDTKEKKVYKAVGNILIPSETGVVRKELESQKESADLRIKTLQKQEDALIDKLNKLKHQIESSQAGAAAGSKTPSKSGSKKK